MIQEGFMGLLESIPRFEPEKGYKFSTYSCVPLDTEIFTQDGWKFYHQLKEGDKTIGYNNGKSEWTNIQGFQTYNDAPLVKFGSAQWSAICTPQHKWLMSENDIVSLKPLTSWPSSQSFQGTKPIITKDGKKRHVRPDCRLITSAPFVGGDSDLTQDEAVLLAWILSDGSLYKGRENPVGAVIIQSRKKFADEIRDLLIKMNAYCSDTKKDNDCLAFNVKAKVFKKVWEKAKLKHQTITQLVLSLKPDVRTAWFNTWYKAEGTLGVTTISQNKGEKLDALQLCAFLEGYSEIGLAVHTEKNCSVRWHTRKRTPRSCCVTPAGRGNVWCPKTDLGTWTARTPDGFVFLTGNTYWIKQAISSYLTENKVGPFVPLHVRVAFKKLLEASKAEGISTQEYIAKHPNIKEELGITPNMLNSIRASRATERVSSIEELQENSNGYLLSDPDALDFSDKTDKQKMIMALKETFKELSYKQQKIILLRFNLI